VRSVAVLIVAGVAMAASPDGAIAGVDGLWRCTKTYTTFNRWGARTGGMTQHFDAALHPNGRFEVQGTDGSVAGILSFTGGGSWVFKENTLYAFGNIQTRMGPSGFNFNGELQHSGDFKGAIMGRLETPYPNGSGVQDRALTTCVRL